MAYRGREIELKLLAENYSKMDEVDKIVCASIGNLEIKPCMSTIEGCASDIYWGAPSESRADFVRLRVLDGPDSQGNTSQITLKRSDKGNNINRVEIDLGVSDHSQANKLLTLMLGDPLGQVTKRYTVYFLENEHTTVSVYRIVRDRRVFVEVEATSLKRVKEITKNLESGGLHFKRIPQSLFELFVLKKGMTPLELEFE